MQKIVKYDSNNDSNFDFELFIKNKEWLNMLLNSHSDLFNWYIDSETFKYIMNSWDFFIIFASYHKKFKVMNDKTITATELENIVIHMKTKKLLLYDVVLVLKCTLSLILLEQL